MALVTEQHFYIIKMRNAYENLAYHLCELSKYLRCKSKAFMNMRKKFATRWRWRWCKKKPRLHFVSVLRSVSLPIILLRWSVSNILVLFIWVAKHWQWLAPCLIRGTICHYFSHHCHLLHNNNQLFITPKATQEKKWEFEKEKALNLRIS